MHIDASKVEAGTRNFDICIIGGGAAGITLARELSSSNTSVGLLEGGDLELKTESQDVYKGKAEGTVFTNDDPYLAASRLRFLGGTTNHWR